MTSHGVTLLERHPQKKKDSFPSLFLDLQGNKSKSRKGGKRTDKELGKCSENPKDPALVSLSV